MKMKTTTKMVETMKTKKMTAKERAAHIQKTVDGYADSILTSRQLALEASDALLEHLISEQFPKLNRFQVIQKVSEAKRNFYERHKAPPKGSRDPKKYAHEAVAAGTSVSLALFETFASRAKAAGIKEKDALDILLDAVNDNWFGQMVYGGDFYKEFMKGSRKRALRAARRAKAKKGKVKLTSVRA